MMNRVNFGKLSGAVIDVCRGHGTFLDAGELHQIVTFIQEGGLDRARAQKLEELREGERRLQALERKAALDRRVRWRVAAGTWRPEARRISPSLIDLITRRPYLASAAGTKFSATPLMQ